MTNLSFRNPWVWWSSVSAFFVTTIVSTIRLFFRLQVSWNVNLVIGLLLILGFAPGFCGALLEFSRTDMGKRSGRIIGNVIAGIMLIFFVLASLRSVNNMVRVLGYGIPFYSLIYGAWTEIFQIGSSVIVLGGVILRKYGLTTNFEEPPTQIRSKWTIGGIMMISAVILIFGGVMIALIEPLALEGLLGTVSGLILFPIGRLVWKRSKNRNRETSA